MLNNLKLDFLENINLLTKLAQNSSDNFPDEYCRFIVNDINLKSALIAKEKERNHFLILNKHISNSFNIYNNIVKVNDYETTINYSNYENDFIGECTLDGNYDHNNIQSFIIFIGTDKYLLIIEHKSSVAESDTSKVHEAAKYLQYLLKLWYKYPITGIEQNKFSSEKFLLKFTNGLTKEIKTISGLLTILKEEKFSGSVAKYIDEVKNKYQSAVSSIDDFSAIIKLFSDGQEFNISSFNIEELVNENISKLRVNYNSIKIDYTDNTENLITADKDKIEKILYQSLSLIADITKSNVIKADSFTDTAGKLRIHFSTESLNLSEPESSSLFDPFEIKNYSENQSGLILSLLLKEVELLNGSINIIDDKNTLSLKIVLPVIFDKSKSVLEIADKNNNNDKNRVLVIESDPASSSLLRNQLNKWNYKTEFVSSSLKAFDLLNINKYVSIILNIEQENENSLEILHKLKYDKSTKNIPVIVFSVEPKEEKIYLMGSVEYLVKPINYNNLIEILTAYKLRRNSNVLCVDDDQPTLNLLNQAVITAGFNSISEYRPELVMDLISDKDIDLAIIDLDMPKLNGYDLIKKIKSDEKFSKLPIIIYTGKEDYQEDLHKIDGMFIDLLEKRSTSINELEKTITDMIKSYEEPRKIEEIGSSNDGPKILMAEDYKHSQIIVTRLLKKSGFENVIVVENGEEALNICECDKIDLILMDMQMPVMNGFEATGKIRELEGYADTPIIALTAFAMKGDREKCLEAGATDYIPKPIDSKEFIEKVKYYTQVKIES